MKTRIQEGGHAVQGDRILKADIEPTMKRFVPILQGLVPDVDYEMIGSTGKKPDNGDIDLAVESTRSLVEIDRAFTDAGYETALNKGLGQVSVKFPQYDTSGKPNGLSVQIDLMVGNKRWMSWMYTGFSPEESAYKPLARTACVYGMLRFAAANSKDKTFYSISPNKGVFQKRITGEKDGKVISEKVNDLIINDPDEVAAIISKQSSEPWTAEELRLPVEKLIFLINKRFPSTIAAAIREYAKDFLVTQKLDVPQGLQEKVKKLSEVKTSHLTHIEDLVIDEGSEGIDKAFRYITGVINRDSSYKTKLKVDGSSSLTVGANYPGIPGYFIGMKNTFSPKAPQIFQTVEQIKERYGESPDLVEKLSYALQAAPVLGIPDGEVWKGDILFTKGDVELMEDEGIDYAVFTPNTLTYAIPADSPSGKRVLRAYIGIAFHTKYKGDDLRTAENTASFDVSIDDLSPPDDVFVMDARLSSEDSQSTVDSRLLAALKTYANGARQLADDIANSSSLNQIFNQFENYAVRKGITLDDLKAYQLEFADWIDNYYLKDAEKKKTDAGKRASGQKAASLKQLLFQDRASELRSLLNLQKGLVSIKKDIISGLESSSSMKSYTKANGKYQKAGHEGFAVSDVEGNIVKLVNREEFSRMNLTRHMEGVDDIVDDLLSRNNLKKRKLTKARDPEIDYKTEVEPTDGTSRDEAAEKFVAAEEPLIKDVLVQGKRPVVLLDVEDSIIRLDFKDAKGSGPLMDAVTTAQMEEEFAYFMYCTNRDKPLPTFEEAAERFPRIDKNWYKGFINGAKLVCSYLENESYIFFREATSFPKVPESIHAIINNAFSARKDIFKKIGRKKDAWNPSDVYACKTSEYSDVLETLKKLIDNATTTLSDFNDYLRGLHSKLILVGISLKKPSKPDDVHSEEANLDGVKPNYDPIVTSIKFPMSSDGMLPPSKSLKSRDSLVFTLDSTMGPIEGTARSFSKDYAYNLTLELRPKRGKAQLGKVGVGIVLEWAVDLDVSGIKEKFNPTMVEHKNADRLIKMAKEINASFPNTIDIKGLMSSMLGYSTSTNSEFKEWVSSIPQGIAYLLLITRAKQRGSLSELLNDIITGAKKEGPDNAPFLKVS